VLDMSREDGLTLPELLTAMWIALIVALGAFALLDFVMKRTQETTQRVDSSQRARLAMDLITRELRSLVCPDPNTPAIAPGTGTTANSVTFYADLTDGTRATAAPTPTGGIQTTNGSAPISPDRRVLRFDATARTIVEDVYRPRGTVNAPTYPATPDRTRTLLANVMRDGTTPLFRYYGFTAGTAPTPTREITPNATTGVPETDTQNIVRIDIAFDALPTNARTTTGTSTRLQDQVILRSFDPENPVAPCPA
jgi:hypothetical protein